MKKIYSNIYMSLTLDRNSKTIIGKKSFYVIRLSDQTDVIRFRALLIKYSIEHDEEDDEWHGQTEFFIPIKFDTFINVIMELYNIKCDRKRKYNI
jgi:hypothetical protein